MNVLRAMGIEDTQIVETKVCIDCGKSKPLSGFKNDKRGRRNVCKQCRNHHLAVARKLKRHWLKKGKSIPTTCECCGKTSDKIVCDHDHETLALRGWICQSCNQGIGLLGDNIFGLENAIRYLKESN